VLDRVKPPINGPYTRRAEVLVAAISTLMKEKFGKGLKPIARDFDQKRTYTWELKPNVLVHVSKAAGSADPSVWIRRMDPHNTPGPGGDWKNEEIGRVYKGQAFHLDVIMEKVAAAVSYNKERAGSMSKSQELMAIELGDVKIPDGVKVSRDSATGKYSVSMSRSCWELDVDEARQLISELSQITQIRKAAEETQSAEA
jgi:uncharacterized Fe-S center protein